MAMQSARVFRYARSPQCPVIRSRQASESHPSLALEDFPQQAKEGLVIRLRSPQQKRTFSEIRCATRPELPQMDQFLIRHSPILKPKTTKRNSRAQSSAGLRSPGPHLDLPEGGGRTVMQMYRFPTMLMLRLLGAKNKQANKRTSSSPSLKYINLQCPISKPPTSRPSFRPKRKLPHSSPLSDYDPKPHSGLYIKRITPMDTKEKQESKEKPAVELEERGRRKVVFTRREKVEMDPDYDKTMETYFQV